MSGVWDDDDNDARTTTKPPTPVQTPPSSSSSSSFAVPDPNVKVIYRSRDYVEPPNPELLLNPNRVVKDAPTKILQRNPGSKPQEQTNTAAPKQQPKSYSERQEEYEKARKRIFDQDNSNTNLNKKP